MQVTPKRQTARSKAIATGAQTSPVQSGRATRSSNGADNSNGGSYAILWNQYVIRVIAFQLVLLKRGDKNRLHCGLANRGATNKKQARQGKQQSAIP